MPQQVMPPYVETEALRQDRIIRVIEFIMETESDVTLENGPLTMTVRGHEIKVRDNKTGFLVAYSMTKADFEQSVDEFVSDFMA
jgi:hypothetical protein